MKDNDPAYLRASATRALQGNTPSTLIAFSAEVSGHVISLRSIFDEAAPEEHIEHLRVVGSEIIADYPAGYTVEEEFWNLAPGGKIIHLQEVIYQRP